MCLPQGELVNVTNESITRQNLAEVWNSEGDLEEIESIVSNDFVYHNPMVSEDVRGPDGYREFVSSFLAAFSNLENEIEDIVGRDDRVTARYTTRGRHTGKIWGIEPTNEDVVIQCILIDYFENGKIKDQYVNADGLGLLTQLGAVDPPRV